jgi:hypothetical protein
MGVGSGLSVLARVVDEAGRSGPMCESATGTGSVAGVGLGWPGGCDHDAALFSEWQRPGTGLLSLRRGDPAGSRWAGAVRVCPERTLSYSLDERWRLCWFW